MPVTYRYRRITANHIGYCYKPAALLCSLAHPDVPLRAVCRKYPRCLRSANVAKLLVVTGLSFLILVPSSGEPRIAGCECPLDGGRPKPTTGRSWPISDRFSARNLPLSATNPGPSASGKSRLPVQSVDGSMPGLAPATIFGGCEADVGRTDVAKTHSLDESPCRNASN
jgi:hypothetical protein